MSKFNKVCILNTCIESVLDKLDLKGLSGKNIFLTGSTGYMGLWLLSTLDALSKKGILFGVWVLSRNPDFFLSRNQQFLKKSWLNFIIGDIKDFQIPKTKFDLILHGATETSPAAHADPTRMFDDIVFGTRRVIELAENQAVSRILLISSGAVYGRQPNGIKYQPDDSKLACSTLISGSAYSEGKRVMELMGTLLNQRTGIEFSVARCFSFSGPGLPLNKQFAIGNFVRDALFKKKIIVKGNGLSRRSYLFGADLALWLLFMLINGKNKMSYNVGSDEAISILALATKVRDLLCPNKPIEIMHTNMSEELYTEWYVPDITRARELGCVPWTSLEDALSATAQYHRTNYMK